METSARLYTLNYNLVLPVMAFKLAVLALIAGFTAQHFRKVTLPLLITHNRLTHNHVTS